MPFCVGHQSFHMKMIEPHVALYHVVTYVYRIWADDT